MTQYPPGGQFSQQPSSPQPGFPHPGPPLMYPPVRPQTTDLPKPSRWELVPGTPFVLAILGSPHTPSGLAIGSLTAGITSILVSMAVWCFGLVGASEGWGALVGGAFTVLASVLGVAGLVLGGLGLRQIKREQGRTGRGMAIAGMICGGVGLLLALSGLALAIALVFSR